VKCLCLNVLLTVTLLSAPAIARTGGDERSYKSAALPRAGVDQEHAAPSLADQIGVLIEKRTALVDRMAPQPAVDCKDPTQVTRRLAALTELDTFARATIAGLIDAAPSNELKSITSEKLVLVLVQHRTEMNTAVANLMELPLVRERRDLSEGVARLADQAARP
jgi:hypothetical protein